MIVRFIWLALCLLRYFSFARTLTTSDVNSISNKIISTFKITPQYGILLALRLNMVCFVMIKSHHVLSVIYLEAFYDLSSTMHLAMVSRLVIPVYSLIANHCFNVVIGGANGCIDFNNPDNKGLQSIIDQLHVAYEGYESIIPIADFWVLAANIIIRYASTTPATCKNHA